MMMELIYWPIILMLLAWFFWSVGYIYRLWAALDRAVAVAQDSHALSQKMLAELERISGRERGQQPNAATPDPDT